ncbi:hypothetical protein PsorP6_000426 [Peronosclerospora sorghi]|uniref:Uncharacterized protein n=1 Tax=Peronosclerospora sorghi TaxID=230839 RepID=A0ACC0WUH1_9STRA|nr:hypothetical protein PsorP6_000426 [Peronosclerospora sorghi]
MRITAQQDPGGWQEIEQTLTAQDLPPAPPTTDPLRLLGYVLHILPRYTEMEMLVTHLRLYALTMEQDLEQVKSHVRLLTREVTGERDKKKFLERYAGQVVKERNDLLHSRGSSKKKTAASHFVWHSCCKKNKNHVIDLAPSILALRGEKLQEATKQVEALQEEVWNQALLQKELDNLLKKTQREHDSKVVADRKHIEQLEKQVVQRSTLHSNLERKLYEVESILARYERTKNEEVGAISKRFREAQARIAGLEEENANLLEQVSSLSDDINQLTETLKETRKSKDVFAEHMDKLSEKCQSLESQVQSLQSEIDILQAKDINSIRAEFAAVIKQLQKDSATREQNLRQNIDLLKQELKKRDGTEIQGNRICEFTAKKSLRRTCSTPTYGLECKSPSTSGDDNIEDSDGGYGQLEFNEVEFTSSVRNSSDSRGSIEASLSNLPRSKLRTTDNSFSMQCYKQSSSHQACVYPKKKECPQSELETGDFNLSLEECKYTSHEKEADTHASDEVFDWETFIDSISEASTHDDIIHHSPSTLFRLSSLSSTVCHELNDITRPNQSIAVEGNEEKKQADADGILEVKKQEQLHNGNGNEKNEPDDYHESFRNDEYAYNDLAQDLHQILNGLEQKRKEEEERASQAQHALQEFQRLQHGLQLSQLPSVSPPERYLHVSD